MLALLKYYIFFIVVFFLHGIMKSRTNHELAIQKSSVQYLNVVMFALWILIGMRNVLYGRDTLGYVIEFNRATSLNLKESVEPGYNLLVYIVRSVTSNYHIYLMIASISTIMAMYRLMRRYFTSSYEIIASICIYVLLGLLAFNMAALRQTIALSFGIFAFMYADDGKWKQFLVCVGVAYLFHNSSIVLLIIYPLRFLNVKRFGLFIALGFFVLGMLYPGLVAPFIQKYLPFEDRFTQYGTTYESSQSYTGFVLQLILILIAYVSQKQMKLSKSSMNLLFNCAYLGLAIQSLTGSLAELYRLSFYFSFFDIILVPIALYSYKGKSADMIRGLFIIGCLIYIFILSGSGVLPVKQNYIIQEYMFK